MHLIYHCHSLLFDLHTQETAENYLGKEVKHAVVPWLAKQSGMWKFDEMCGTETSGNIIGHIFLTTSFAKGVVVHVCIGNAGAC